MSVFKVWNVGFREGPPADGVEYEEQTDPVVLERYAELLEKEIAKAEAALLLLREGYWIYSRYNELPLTEADTSEYLENMKRDRRTPERQRLFKVRIQ